MTPSTPGERSVTWEGFYQCKIGGTAAPIDAVVRSQFFQNQPKLRTQKLIRLRTMECPRCKSTRIQRGYNDPRILLRIGGAHELLCNNCGLEFKSFKWAATFKRVAGKGKGSEQNRRRAPRHKVHLPVTIRLVDQAADNQPSLSQVVRGHCQTISSLGMALSFVGSHFDRAELKKPGRLLLVVVSLPSGAMEVLVKAITSERIENADGPASWFVGASIVQISDADRSLLTAYLAKRSQK